MSAEEKAKYTRAIDGILRESDLETVSRKAIMRGLEEAVEKDLSDQKVRCHQAPVSRIAFEQRH